METTLRSWLSLMLTCWHVAHKTLTRPPHSALCLEVRHLGATPTHPCQLCGSAQPLRLPPHWGSAGTVTAWIRVSDSGLPSLRGHLEPLNGNRLCDFLDHSRPTLPASRVALRQESLPLTALPVCFPAQEGDFSENYF